MPELELKQLMTQEEAESIGIENMSKHVQESLLNWGMRMFALGQHHIGEIEEVKYDGRLIILNDGSRWEVDELDAGTADLWSFLDKVIVIDDEMYNLEGTEKVTVQEE